MSMSLVLRVLPVVEWLRFLLCVLPAAAVRMPTRVAQLPPAARHLRQQRRQVGKPRARAIPEEREMYVCPIDEERAACELSVSAC